MSSPTTPSQDAAARRCRDCGGPADCNACHREWRVLACVAGTLIVGWLQLLYLAIQTGIGR